MSALVILDWTADRLRGWRLPVDRGPGAPGLLTLDDATSDLPLAISLAGRKLQAGRAAKAMARSEPHRIATGFLPFLGEDRHWQFGRHEIDARDALQFILTGLRGKLPGKALFHLVPSYWTGEQAALLGELTRTLGLRMVGIVRRSLAASGGAPGLVMDADAYAVTLTATTLIEPGPRLRLVRTVVLRELALPLWKERIAEQIAMRCVRDARRDPRAAADTDQMLDAQIETQLRDWAANLDGRVDLQGADWEQELTVPAALVQSACQPLAAAVARHVTSLGESSSWFLTEEAARLPGLAGALYLASGNQRSVAVLAPEQLVRTAGNWAKMVDRGHLPPPDFEASPAPIPDQTEPDPDTLPFPSPSR
jgi:hypothetical protein